MEFWRLIKQPLRQRSIVMKVMRDLESGQFGVSRSFDALSKYKTEQLSLKTQHPVKVQLPERSVLQEFLRKYPEAKSEPVALDSFRPPLARQFAHRQLQLMFGGVERTRAFQQVEAEMAPQLQALRRRQMGGASSSGSVELLQRQEEEALREGLLQHAGGRLAAGAGAGAGRGGAAGEARGRGAPGQ